jgi:hypothetical protein
MPRYDSQNLAAIDSDFRKAHNISLGGGGGGKKSPYMYGKQNNVLIASGAELFANGLCLRLLPLYAQPEGASDRQFVNFREGRDNAMFGDWSRLLTCAHWVGNPGVCFIIHDGNPEINLYESPYHVLRNVAWNNSSKSKSGIAHPTLGRLFDDLLSDAFAKNSHIGSLKKAEPTLFVSASVITLDDSGRPVLGSFTDDRKKNARIIGLKTSAAHSLYSALGVQDDATHDFVCGDMLSFSGAKLVTFLPETYQGDGKNRTALSADGITGVKVPKFAQQTNPLVVGYPPSRSSMTHFAVVHDSYNGQEISLEPYAERLVAESLSWDEYLNIPTYEEQAEILASRFPREILDFAWREFPQYLRHVPTGTTTFAGVAPADEDYLPEEPAKPAARPQSFVKPTGVAQSFSQAQAPQADPPAPWDPLPAAEISAEEEAGVMEMFSTAPGPVGEPGVPGPTGIPPGATSAPPAVAAPKPAAAGKLNSAEILARAKARAAANK